MANRKITIFTGNRAEYGLLYPLMQVLKSQKSVELSLIVSGSHLSDRFGMTACEIDTVGIKKVRMIDPGSPLREKILDVPMSFSSIIRKVFAVLKRLKPDIIVLAGDRYETFAVAVASFYMNIPIAHLFGGDLSQGGHLDDSVRHAITKLAHLHFTTNGDSYSRVLKLGEEKWRVFNTGSTAVDNAVSGMCASPEALAAEFDIDLSRPLILFTQHPVTTESDMAYDQVKESLEALKELGYQTVITYPCNDAGGDLIIKAIKQYTNRPYFRIVKSLGWKKYLGFLKVASCVAGNSSSGIMETPVFKVPFVNIGPRQAGRLRAENVIDVPYDKTAIKKAISKALHDRTFISKVKNCRNPYGNGKSAIKIAEVLKTIPINKALLQKKMTF